MCHLDVRVRTVRRGVAPVGQLGREFFDAFRDLEERLLEPRGLVFCEVELGADLVQSGDCAARLGAREVAPKVFFAVPGTRTTGQMGTRCGVPFR